MTKDTRRKVLLLLGSVLFSLLLGEAGIRTYDAVRGAGFFSGRRNPLARPKPVLPFLTFGFPLYEDDGGQRFISSRHGELYPLRKGGGVLRVVAFGGSTTENVDVVKSHGTHYPRELEKILRQRLGRDGVEVINVGNSAYATPHALILLSLHVLSWEPDIVILSENVNDLTAAYFPRFVSDYANKYSHPTFGLPDFSERDSLTNRLFQHSQLYWAAKSLLVAQRLRRDDRYRIRRVSYGNEPPAQARDVFKRNLRSFVVLAKSRGIKVVLGTQPLERSEEYFERHVMYKPYNDVVRYPLHAEFVRHHESYNRAIKEVATEEGATLADNDAVLGGQSALFSDYVHYTLEGVRRLAASYADVLERDQLVR
jgi:lysophospholipase L1-like esterase